MPALPSWLTDPLLDRFAALLPHREVCTTPLIRWAVTGAGLPIGSCSTSCCGAAFRLLLPGNRRQHLLGHHHPPTA